MTKELDELYLGRPQVYPTELSPTIEAIRQLHAEGQRIVQISRQVGCNIEVVLAVIRGRSLPTSSSNRRAIESSEKKPRLITQGFRVIRHHTTWSRDMYLPRKERAAINKPILETTCPVEEPLPYPTTPNHELATPRKKKKSPPKRKIALNPSLHTRSKDTHALTSLVPEGETIPIDQIVQFILDNCAQILTNFERVVVCRRLAGESIAHIANDTNHSYDYTENCAVWGFQKVEISILNPAGYRSVGSYKDRNFTARVQKGKSIRSIKIGKGRYVLDEDAKKFIKP